MATIFSWFFWSFQYFLPVFKCPFRWFLKTPSVEVLWRPKTKFDRVEPSHALILCDEWKAGWTRFLEDGDQSCKRDKRICRGRGRQSHCHLCYKGKFRKWINFGQEKKKRFKTMLDYYLYSWLGTAGLIFKKESEFLWRKYYVYSTTSILTFWREKSTKLPFQVKIPMQKRKLIYVTENKRFISNLSLSYREKVC